jgi:hypothetical protein
LGALGWREIRANIATLRDSIPNGSSLEPELQHHALEITNFNKATMALSLFLFFWPLPPATMTCFSPVQKYVALEKQKMMLFEYGQPFKLHKRSRAELYKATVGH